MASVSHALRSIKDSPLQLPGILDPRAVADIFRSHGHEWRERVLSPAVTLELLLRQVIAGNIPCTEVRHLVLPDHTPDHTPPFTASAYCQARARLPVAAVWEICRQVTAILRDTADSQSPRWRGHRTFYVDGTGFSMPDTPELQSAFGQPGQQRPGCGFPVAHLLMLFDAATGMALEAVPAPLRTHDLRDVQRVHEPLSAGDILMGDCAFGSWTHLALLQRPGVQGLFGLHQRRRRVRGNRINFDRIERWPKPPRPPAWMSREEFEALPGQIEVRVIGRRIRRNGFRPVDVIVATTLLDAVAYTADEIIALHRQRWDVETSIGHLKTTMGLDVLRCKTVAGVLRELAAFLLVYNLVRAVMLRAAARQRQSPRRISFVDALRWIRHTRMDAMLYDLMVNPERPGRIEPRVVKRRCDRYDCMTRSRAELRKALKLPGKAA